MSDNNGFVLLTGTANLKLAKDVAKILDKSTSVAATHGLFSPPALERINKAPLDIIFIADTVPFKKEVLEN